MMQPDNGVYVCFKQWLFNKCEITEAEKDDIHLTKIYKIRYSWDSIKLNFDLGRKRFMKVKYSCSLTSCSVQFFSDKNYKKDKGIRD